ncbi:MAG: hypothetical protein KA795_20460, partial [Burkholderiaceae bacterium]|nr:hypothetical protein [Burkholderiaceae bacterium]
HLSEEAGKASLFGGLAASGWHTAGIVMRLMCDGFLLQSSSLVGRSVLTEGNAMTRVEDTASGVFELSDAATSVKVEVLTPGGVVLDTLQLGALGSGTHGFSWDASQYNNADLRFKVTASNSGTAVESKTFMRDKVVYVGVEGGALSLELETNGAVAYGKIKGVL